MGGWFDSAMCRVLCLCAVCVLCISSPSQQYDVGDSSGGNIFMGSLFNQESLPPGQVRHSDTTSDSQCSFTFLVPQAQIQGAGCMTGKGRKDPKMSMTKMHEDIIEVESRMIARDAHTRREMQELRRQFNIQRARKESSGTHRVNSQSVDELATTVATMDSQVLKLEALMSSLIDQVTNLEEKVLSAESASNRIAQYLLQGNCPPEFERFNSSCYAYYRDKRTWYKSQDFCQELGGHLVSIETNDEQEFIKDYLKRKGVRRDSFWVYAGGNDLDNDQEWTWIGSNHVIRHPDFWYSDVTPAPDTGFVCMFLYLWDPNNFAKWTKDRCDFQMPSICEIPLVLGPL